MPSATCFPKDHARRGKPPLHFADMTEEERIAKSQGSWTSENSGSSSLPIIITGISMSTRRNSPTSQQRKRVEAAKGVFPDAHYRR